MIGLSKVLVVEVDCICGATETLTSPVGLLPVVSESSHADRDSSDLLIALGDIEGERAKMDRDDPQYGGCHAANIVFRLSHCAGRCRL